MRILAISDEKSKHFYDFYKPGMLNEFDLIIACGDLEKSYLEFLVTLAHCPVIYVHGNHDDSYRENPPEGCICIEDQIFEYKGVRFLGLGGSYRYKQEGRYMYTEQAMKLRIRKLWIKIRKAGGFDVLVSHAPAFGQGDLNTLSHRGFQCFLKLMEKYKPKYFIHGHVHKNYGVHIPTVSRYHETTIINACGYHIFDYKE